MVKQQLFIGAALLAGVAIGYFAAPQTSRPEAEVEEDLEFIASSPIAVGDQADVIAALRARIGELESALLTIPTNELTVASEVQPERRERRGFGNPGEWLETMKRENPEQYTQMTNRFAQWRQSRVRQQQSKLDFFGSIDTSNMSASARENHEKLQDLIVKREELESEIAAPDLSWEDRGKLFQEMRAIDEELRAANEIERKALLEETAAALGLKGEDAEALASTVREIYQNTESGWGRGPGGGPGGARGPRGGGRGR